MLDVADEFVQATSDAVTKLSAADDLSAEYAGSPEDELLAARVEAANEAVSGAMWRLFTTVTRIHLYFGDASATSEIADKALKSLVARLDATTDDEKSARINEAAEAVAGFGGCVRRDVRRSGTRRRVAAFFRPARQPPDPPILQ